MPSFFFQKNVREHQDSTGSCEMTGSSENEEVTAEGNNTPLGEEGSTPNHREDFGLPEVHDVEKDEEVMASSLEKPAEKGTTEERQENGTTEELENGAGESEKNGTRQRKESEETSEETTTGDDAKFNEAVEPLDTRHSGQIHSDSSQSNDQPLNLSDSAGLQVSGERYLHASDTSEENEDVSRMTASRCRVYENTVRKSSGRRGWRGETSLTICGVENLLAPYKCRDDCNFSSASLSALKIHSLLRHSDEDLHACTLCGERFVCTDSLLEHVCRKHYDHNRISFPCKHPDCSRSFQRIEGLKSHLSAEHKDSASFPCSFCFREFYSAETAASHIRRHLKQTLRCAYCLDVFASRDEVVDHVKSAHVGFLRKINLHVEVLNHERKAKEKIPIAREPSGGRRPSSRKSCEEGLVISPILKPLPYQCQDCSYTCSDEHLLNTHIKVGHLEQADITKDFSCNFCKFSTNSKESMVTHLSFHTNAAFLRCYSCPYCPKESNSLDIMECHLHSRHPSEQFRFEASQESVKYLQDFVSCPLCWGAFKWKTSFCAHLSTVHNLDGLADYLNFRCSSDASKSSLVLPRQFLADRLGVVLPASFYARTEDGGQRQTIESTGDDFAFKCIKCEFSSSNYSKYNEHVKRHYEVDEDEEEEEEGTKSSALVKKEAPMMFVCKLCPFRCNKSLNFKRHSAIHERAKSLENCFRCGYCMFRHDRINCIKFHLGKYHERLPVKVVRITNGREVDVTETEMVVSGDREEPQTTSRKEGGKTSNEYFDSFLPRGMIFAQPVKCPSCEYANRVRVNLIRHMRQHLNEDSLLTPKIKVVASQEGLARERDVDSEPPAKHERRHSVSGETPTSGDSSLQLFAEGVTTKKLFKCAYCDVVSKWNRRDISLHILHVHLQKKVYTCSYCDYGSRKSSQMVMNHCARVHPGKPVIIKDELALFNSVVPLRDGDGVIPVAYVKRNGTPILTLSELGTHLKLSVRKNKNDVNHSDKDEKETTTTTTTTAHENKMAADDVQDIDDEDYGNNLDNSDEWKCMFCGLQMFSEAMMKRHVMCHHMKLKPYSCKYCSASYWQKQSVENHVRSSHPGEEPRHVENVKEKMSLLSKYMQKLTNVHRIRQTPCKKYSSVYHCRICGYQDPRHDKAKYHVVKKHLKIGLYSCSKCHQYMGGKGCVENHIQEFHPDSDAYVCRSYDVHALFLQKNIRKIANLHLNKGAVQRNAGKRSALRIKTEAEAGGDQPKPLLTCKYCSYVAETEASLGAHARVHKVFACFYCDYQNSLVSKVQSHCLVRHPAKPIKHRQIAPISSSNDPIGRGPIGGDVNNQSTNDTSHSFDDENTCSEPSTGDFPDGFSPPEPPSDRCAASRPGIEYLYKCKICSYNSEKATVMRHHIMSHLLYHPYQCPYCNLVCSVKSSPITKHIQLKHPDEEIRFICKRDEQMERQVRNSFEKISLDREGNVTGVEEASHVPATPRDEQHFAASQKVYYKCCFCSLVTPIRTDMKHHLMRELKYKPFSCAYCQYEEPCRSKMGKHFRIKHPGMTISIKHAVNTKRELQIFECLQKCLVKSPSGKSERSAAQDKSGNIPIIRISNMQNGLISSLHYRGKYHECFRCHFKTSNIKTLVSHKSVHDKFRLKCSYCPYSSSNVFLLRRHRGRCNARKVLVPSKPKRVTSQWMKSLKQDVSNFASTATPFLKAKYSARWTCAFCSRGFFSMFLLGQHLKKCRLRMSSSGRDLPFPGSVRPAEEKQKSSSITFCCNECQLKFTTLEDFSLHLQTHYARKVTFPVLEVFPDDVTSRLHLCGFCSFQTTEEEDFTDHVTTHTALQPIKCKHCLFASFTSSDMKQHFEAQHPNQDVGFDSLSQPYTMALRNNDGLPNFKPVVRLVDLKFCLS